MAKGRVENWTQDPRVPPDLWDPRPSGPLGPSESLGLLVLQGSPGLPGTPLGPSGH